MTSATKEKPATAAAEHAEYPAGYSRGEDARKLAADPKCQMPGTSDARTRLLGHPKSPELKEELLNAQCRFRAFGRIINAGARDLELLKKDELGFRQPHQAAQLAGIRRELKFAGEFREELLAHQEAARQAMHAIQERVLAG